MGHSKIINFLYRILPFHAWKDWLLRHHIENCPACREKLVSREEARWLLVQADEVGDVDRLWPSIKEKLGRKVNRGEKGAVPKPAMVKLWRLAAGAAVLLIAVLISFWLFEKPRPEISIRGGGLSTGEPEQVQIHYVKIENEPAQTFIFKPHDSNVVIVWAAKNF